MAPPSRSGAGSRGGGGDQAADHIFAGSINRLGEAVDEEEPGVKEQEDVEEDQVTPVGRAHVGLGGCGNGYNPYRVAAVGKLFSSARNMNDLEV